MGVCLTCLGTAPPRGMCIQCARALRTCPPARLLASGLVVRSAFLHEGPARRLVHALKYQGIERAALPLAAAMAELVPCTASCFVPAPRSWARRIKHGIDPAATLAAALSAETGLPVVRALAAPIWWPAHAGKERVMRAPPRFRAVAPAPAGWVLVDDVLTTGATLSAAAMALGAPRGEGLTATLAGTLGGAAATAHGEAGRLGGGVPAAVVERDPSLRRHDR